MEKNLSSTCTTYARVSSIERTCFKEIGGKICGNSYSVNTWLRHPGSLLTREWRKYPLPLLIQLQSKWRTVSLSHLPPFPKVLYPRDSENKQVQFSRSVLSNSLRPHEPQHARPPCPSPTPGVHPNPCPLSRWCHLTISSPVVPFSSCPQSLPASGSFQMSQLFAWGGQSVGVSASASIPPMNTQDWFPLGWTSWISLQSKGLLRVLSNTTVQKHQFFSTQLSSHYFTSIYDHWKNHSLD